MKLTDEGIGTSALVRSYAPGEVRVGERLIRHSCLLAVGQRVEDWRPQTLDELTLADLEPIFALAPEIVVLGSGTRQRFPEVEWSAALLARGIGCEIMDTGAACRTYNILATEDRRVVAALLLR